MEGLKIYISHEKKNNWSISFNIVDGFYCLPSFNSITRSYGISFFFNDKFTFIRMLCKRFHCFFRCWSSFQWRDFFFNRTIWLFFSYNSDLNWVYFINRFKLSYNIVYRFITILHIFYLFSSPFNGMLIKSFKYSSWFHFL